MTTRFHLTLGALVHLGDPEKIYKIQITLDNLYAHPLPCLKFFGETMPNIIVTINQTETDVTCWWWWANSHGLAGGRI